jgi:polycomb protein EED
LFRLRPEVSNLELVQEYQDDSKGEELYTAAWSVDPFVISDLLLAVGGKTGIVKVINTGRARIDVELVGHTGEINALLFHPFHPTLLASASMDASVRLWNVKTRSLLIIFGGRIAHAEAVYCLDWDTKNERLVTGGHDRRVCLWNIPYDKIGGLEAAAAPDVEDSDKDRDSKKPLPVAGGESSGSGINSGSSSRRRMTHLCYEPAYCTDAVHGNAVDQVHWLGGNLILSKSTFTEEIVLWEAILTPAKSHYIPSFHQPLLRFPVPGTPLGTKFSQDESRRLIALGTEKGEIHLFDIDDEAVKPVVLQADCLRGLIRVVLFNWDASSLLAFSDVGQIVRFDGIRRHACGS